MNVECLLRDSMKTKPKSNRGARQKTSTPKNVTRMNYNENPYGMSDEVKKAVTDASLNSYMYQDFYAVDLKKQLADFYGNYATEEETAETIRKIYKDCGYVIDTHTSVAATVYKKYTEETGDTAKTVIASTASPYKFTRSVMEAIDEGKYAAMGDFELIDQLSEISGVAVPNAIEEIRNAEVRHNTVADVAEMPVVVKKILGIQ